MDDDEARADEEEVWTFMLKGRGSGAQPDVVATREHHQWLNLLSYASLLICEFKWNGLQARNWCGASSLTSHAASSHWPFDALAKVVGAEEEEKQIDQLAFPQDIAYRYFYFLNR